MTVKFGGLKAECTKAQAPQTSQRILAILEGHYTQRAYTATDVVIVDITDKVFYEVINGVETKQDIPV